MTEATTFGRVARLWNSPVGGFIKLAIGLVVLAYVLTTLDWATLRKLSDNITVLDLALVGLTAMLGHVLGAVRFKILVDPVIRLPLVTHVGQYFVGSFFSMFLPSSMGGDGARVVLLKAAGAPATEGASLILTERVLGSICLLMLAAGGALFSPLPATLRIGVPAAAAAALGTLFGLRLLSRRGTPKNAVLARALNAVRSALGRGRLPGALAISLLYQFVGGVLVTVVVDRALGLGVPDATILALTPLVWFATALPISVGGVGVREAGFVVAFGWGGIDRERALLLSLGTYAGLAAIGMTGALWFTWDRVRGAARTRTETPGPH